MNAKKIVIIVSSAMVFILAIACIIFKALLPKEEPVTPNITTTTTSTAKEKYEEFDTVADVFTNANDFSKNYADYKLRELSLKSDGYDAQEFNSYNYAVITYNLAGCHENIDDITFDMENGTLSVYFDIRLQCGLCAPERYVLYKKVPKSIKNVKTYYRNMNEPSCNQYVAYKPIIYVYPTEDIDLTVKLGNKEALTHTYPKYKDSWNVHVTKDSNIYDYDTKRNYYALYWEAKDPFVPDMKEGFVVEGKDTIKLLEDKLEVLGLNEREINEFIVYWIDKIENNKYNYIYFRTTDKVNELMPLEFSKNPETLIRVLVDIVPLDEKIEVKEQKLEPVTRTGYTVVEWGGNIHKNI